MTARRLLVLPLVCFALPAAAKPALVEPGAADETEDGDDDAEDDDGNDEQRGAPEPTGAAASGAFTQIRVAGAVDLDLTGRAKSHKTKVDCPTKNGPGVELKVQGATLHISPKHEGLRLGRCRVAVWAPQIAGVEIAGAADVEGRNMRGLEALAVAGAGDFDLVGIDSDRLEVQISGAGEAELEGRVGELEVSLAGAGEVEAKGLTARRAELSIAGAGEIEITVTEAVKASTAGAGDIDIYGNPKDVQRKTRGAGRVTVH
jgi:hypothetical protein